MPTDRYGTSHSTQSPGAVAAFEAAVHGIAAHQPSTSEALARALAADPHLIAGHALKGLASVILAREELLGGASQSYRDAMRALEKRRGTACERALTEALGFAIRGRLLAAADRLEAHLAVTPRSFLAAKLAHALRFMMGDAPGMLASTSRVVRHWSEDDPGFGFLLGCHAFSLEERGALAEAERVGRRAVALEPADSWGLHAVSHVHEMGGRVDEGIAWLEASRPTWKACNNFSFHMAWHLALFHLERENHDSVLVLYDTEVRPAATDDFRDVANAVSLLWRLEQDGVDVGGRWQELREIALRRRHDTTLTFAALHHLLTLVAVGEVSAAGDLVAAMAARAREADISDQAAVMNRVGLDLAAVILGLAGAGAARGSVARLAAGLPAIGGSHAQRDVFLRTLAAIAAEQGDRRSVDTLLSARRRLKRDDRFARDLERRLAVAEAKPNRRFVSRNPSQEKPSWIRPVAMSSSA